MAFAEKITVSAKQRYAKLKKKLIKFHVLIWGMPKNSNAFVRLQTVIKDHEQLVVVILIEIRLNMLDKCIDNNDPNWVVLNANNAQATIKN